MSIQEEAQELAESFELFDDWEDRYRFLIDMGKALPPLDESQKTDANKIHGCQSNVWMVADRIDDGKLDFLVDSDSSIVRGLAAILRAVYAKRQPQEILGYDIKELFKEIGLDQHLSMGRRNGLDGMVARIREEAGRN